MLCPLTILLFPIIILSIYKLKKIRSITVKLR